MIDDELKEYVIEDVVLLKLIGFKPIIVHGGGKEISRSVDEVRNGDEVPSMAFVSLTRRPWSWLRWYWLKSTKNWSRRYRPWA